MKSLQRILAVVRKEVRQLRRDRLTFGMIVGIPVIQLLMFGYAINMDVRNLNAAVADMSGSAASRPGNHPSGGASPVPRAADGVLIIHPVAAPRRSRTQVMPLRGSLRGRLALAVLGLAAAVLGGSSSLAAQEMELPVPAQMAMISQIFGFDRQFQM